MTFWLNGEWAEDERAISIADRGFLLGDGVFETLLVKRGAAAFLDAHVTRLRAGMEATKIAAAIPADLDRIIADLAVKNRLSGKTATLRLTVSRGAGGRGLNFSDAVAAPTVLLSMALAVVDDDPAPTTLIISTYARAETSISSRHKTTGYLDNILARHEAREMDADDAVMLNSAGRISCASAANIFVITPDSVVITPALTEGALAGIVRGELLAHADATGADICEGEIDQEMVRNSTIFLTNSLVGLREARLAGHESAKSPAQREILNRLQAWYGERLKADLAERAPSP